MEEHNVNIGKERAINQFGVKFLAFLRRISPFGLGTLKEMPWPTLAVPIAIVFFFGLWHGYERNFDNSRKMLPQLAKFLQTERSDKPLNPKILVIGSSYNSLGIHCGVLTEKLNVKVGKVAEGSLVFQDAFNMVKKYESDMSNVRVIIMNLTQQAFDRYGLRYQEKFKPRVIFLKSPLQCDIRSDFPLSFSECFCPMKFSLRDINENRKTPVVAWSLETAPESYKTQLIKKPFISTIQERIESYRKDKMLGKNTYHQLRSMDETQFDLVAKFVDYCQARGIFVVFNIWPGEVSSSFSWGNLNTSVEYKYVTMVKEMQNHSNSVVLIVSNYDEILETPRDYNRLPALTYDDQHVMYEGAMIYTNWLADQMQRDPKIMAALNTERKPPEFFVKRWVKQVPYAKESYQYLAGFIKKPPTNGDAPAKPVLVASPPKKTTK